MQKQFVLIFVGLCAISMLGCEREVTVQKTEPIMGTDVTVTVVAKTEREGEEAINAAMAEIKRIDAMMSLYRDDSQIVRVNRAAGEHSVQVASEMIEVAEAARSVSERSNGAFDATVGPLIVLWQMRLKEGTVPTDKEIRSVRSRVNYKDLLIDGKASTLFLTRKGMIMDFGGAAKGYAADRAADVLKRQGIMNALVAVAGDIRATGKRQDGKPWRIGVQHPRAADKLITAIELSDRSISTSGDYERFTIVNKKRYHHVIDPRTGKPSEGVESVTVIGERGTFIDPLTTALFILGPERGMKIATDLGYEAIFVDDTGAVTATGGIQLQ